MLIKILGRNKIDLILGVILLLAIVPVSPALGATGSEKAAPPPPPAPATPAVEPEIIFNGKVFCSLKRRVDLPFKGTITEVLVKSGDQVKRGQVLAKYRISQDARMAIQRRLSPPQIADGEMRLIDIDRSMAPVRDKQRELGQLVSKKLAPSQSLEQLNRDYEMMAQTRAGVQSRLDQERKFAKEDAAFLKKLLGSELPGGQVPQEVALVAPISGHVIWISPDLQVNAEMDPTPGVFQVGVMNPMVVRGQAFEIEALQIKPGEVGQVTLESNPGQKFQGTVDRISWASLTPGLDQPAYYDVELKVPNPNLDLKDGLKAQIIFRNPK